MLRKPLIASGVIIAIMAGLTLWASTWLGQYDQIPLHWNAAGEADRFGSPKEATLLLWFLVGMTAFVAGLLAIVPSLDPKRENLEKSWGIFLIAWIGTLLLMLAVLVAIIFVMHRALHTGEMHLGEWFPRGVIGAVGVLFAVLGNYLPKVRSNWFLGIRTPWTLSNEVVWERTHRFGGYGMMLGGLVMIVSAVILPVIWMVGIGLAAALIPTLGAVVYSYVIWRQETGGA